MLAVDVYVEEELSVEAEGAAVKTDVDGKVDVLEQEVDTVIELYTEGAPTDTEDETIEEVVLDGGAGPGYIKTPPMTGPQLSRVVEAIINVVSESFAINSYVDWVHAVPE